MPDLVTLTVIVVTLHGALPPFTEPVERAACAVARQDILRATAYHNGHDAAMRGWSVRVSDCGGSVVLPDAAEGRGR
jgi:hypothetical protein